MIKGMNSIFYGLPKTQKLFGGKFQQLTQYINNNNNALIIDKL